MGLFSRKKKITVDDLAMQMMLASADVEDKLKSFYDIDASRTLAVNTGYFYGFLKLHLNSITSLETANAVISESIANFENATKSNPDLAKIGQEVREIANKTIENMKFASKNTSNIFMGMATFYIIDLQNSNTIDISKLEAAESNMRLLYGITSNLTKDIKIVCNEKPKNSNKPAAPNKEIRFCRKCGQKLLAGSKFCNNCGTRVVDAKE